MSPSVTYQLQVWEVIEEQNSKSISGLNNLENTTQNGKAIVRMYTYSFKEKVGPNSIFVSSYLYSFVKVIDVTRSISSQ